MSESVTITLSSDGYSIKKWTTISSGGDEMIVIRVNKKDGAINTSVIQYEKQDNRFAQFVWVQVLKLIVFLRII
jgi:hypothetical protein